MKNKISQLTLFAIIFFVATIILNPVLAQDDVPLNQKCPEGEICLNVPIGNVKQVSDFGEYIQLWYNFVVGGVGIIAVVVIMWGGFKWLTSRGNASVIGEAKEIIWAAIIGLILVFLSYSILAIINPALINIGLPNLPGRGDVGTSGDIRNTDGDVDNDSDILNQLRSTERARNQWSSSDLPGEVFGGFTSHEDAIGFLISQNDLQSLAIQLATHNINLTNDYSGEMERGDFTNLIVANVDTIAGMGRIGETFGTVSAEYIGDQTYAIEQPDDHIIDSILNRDSDSYDTSTSITSQGFGVNAETYIITTIDNVDFDYIDSQGQIHHYDIRMVGNRLNGGIWEIEFLQP